MTIKASKPAAWILAAGLLACIGTPSFAGEALPWPTTTAVTTSNSQQAAPNAAATDQAGAADTTAAQPSAVDRSLSADQRPADDAVASVQAADPNATQVSASSEDGGGWDKASLVGKIFIAAGTLLTLGSAARMFMI